MTLRELQNECARLIEEGLADPDCDVYITYKDVAYGEWYVSKAGKPKPVVTDGSLYTFESIEDAKQNVTESVLKKLNLRNAVGIGEEQ